MSDLAASTATATATATAADEARRRELRRMKVLATGLFVLAATVYAVTTVLLGRAPRDGGVLGYVNAGAEAAMVGALADWFAVTALFRRPLGLPIPHTAIIPTRKDALGRNLQEFVATNFLAEGVVRERVAGARVAGRLGSWLADPGHADRVTAEVASLTRGAMRVLKDETVVSVIEQVFLRRVTQRPWGPAVGRLLGRVVADGGHHRLVDVGVAQLHAWLLDNEAVIERIVMERAPAWTPSWVDQRVARRAYAEALAFAADIRDDPRHRARIALDDLLLELAGNLQFDPATIARADAVRERLLAHPDLRDGLGRLWATVRQVLEDAVDDPDSDLRRRASLAVGSLGRRLQDDDALRRTVDGYVVDAVGHLVSRYRDEVVTVISETVQRWDATEASRRIELHVGKDLQFIRINGTVVGGLAGLVIHALTVLAR